MIKLAHFIDSTDPGGAETLVIEISKRLAEHRFDVEVLHFGNPWLSQQCTRFGITCTQVSDQRFYRSVKTLPLFALSFARFLRQRRVDLLHSHLFGSITAASLAAALSRIGHVGTLHDTYTIEERPSRFTLLQGASLLGTRLVVVSESMRTYFNHLSRFYRPSVRMIFNGINLKDFDRPRNNSLRRQLGLGVDDVVLICVARLIDIKRHDLLIKAFSLVRTDRSVKLLIVGDGPCQAKLEQLISHCKLQLQVTIVGFREDVAELLGLSDCFVLSSDSEGLSYSVIESMAAGIPAIVTDVGGNRELVKHGESGYLVPKGDAEGLATYVQELVEDQERRHKFGENARKWVREGFSIDHTVNEYVQLYREIIGNSS
jgi:N-acetyl-alpha-D-glucosaminyl L-malate synthase BshA